MSRADHLTTSCKVPHDRYRHRGVVPVYVTEIGFEFPYSEVRTTPHQNAVQDRGVPSLNKGIDGCGYDDTSSFQEQSSLGLVDHNN